MPKIFHLDDITDSDMSSLLHSNESTSQVLELMLQEIANKSNSQYLLQLLQRDNVLFSGVVFHFLLHYPSQSRIWYIFTKYPSLTVANNVK